MKPSILSLATALPPHSLSQEDFANLYEQILPLGNELKEKMRKLFRNTNIDQRYAAILDSNDLSDQKTLHDYLLCDGSPGMTKRNLLYKKHAPKLAKEAAEKALVQWNQPREQITHVICVSCTGVLAPGIEFLLIEQLGLKRTVERLGINFMGCFGAFAAMRTARAIAEQDRSHRILVVCVELCSLHFQLDVQMDTLVGNSLFADGAASIVVGQANECESPLWEIINSGSYALENSLDEMTWEGSDHGYVMRLSERIPLSIHSHIRDFATYLVEKRAPLEECCWSLHPGGKAILFAAAKACGITRQHLQSSWEVLRQYGNMSSPTALFVLDHLTQQKPKQEWCVGIGFGPGLSLEGWLLRNASHTSC